MYGEGFFYEAFVFLLAAVVAVPIAKRLALGSVLGYLLAGVAIGPYVLGLLGTEGQDVMHFAEFGVVMMLFLVGLELEPSLLWKMRTPILGLGGLQVAITSLAIAAIAMALGLDWRVALAIGLILSLSSTALVLQTMAEKGLMRTAAGQSSFAVLLFQDIAFIPMLALLPLLATAAPDSSAAHGEGTATWLELLPTWAHPLALLGAIALIVVAGRLVVCPALRIIARTRLREIFVAAALLLVIGTSLLMAKVGLSPALGTFLAGVVLATSEFRHELESDIEPFKGLLLGLFFLAVGASIDFTLIAGRPLLIGGLVVGLVATKLVLLLALGTAFRMGVDQTLLFGLALAQGGEFAFVLSSFAVTEGVLESELASTLVVVVALTMLVTPLLLLLGDKLLLPRIGTRRAHEPADDIEGESPVIIAGYGRFGQIVGRLLDAKGIGTTVLDIDSNRVDLLRRFGHRVYYGDANRYDLLLSAGAGEAQLLVLALDQHDKTLELVHTARRHFPHLVVLARATGRTAAYELLDAGVEHVYRETLDSALALGTAALRELGVPAYRAHRSARSFRRQDEIDLRELGAHRKDEKRYVRMSLGRRDDLARLLRRDLETGARHEDSGWDTDTLRREYGVEKGGTTNETAQAQSPVADEP
jgi:monovalent cation:proton antiporter-2 (CPA2) family protein